MGLLCGEDSVLRGVSDVGGKGDVMVVECCLHGRCEWHEGRLVGASCLEHGAVDLVVEEEA